MNTKSFEVRKGGNVRVKVYASTVPKNGKDYTEYKASDYFTVPGKRKLWTFTDEADARKRASEIAEAIANGQKEAASLMEWQRREYVEAVEMLRPLEMNVKAAAIMVSQALQIIGEPGQLLVAAQFYKSN